MQERVRIFLLALMKASRGHLALLHHRWVRHDRLAAILHSRWFRQGCLAAIVHRRVPWWPSGRPLEAGVESKLCRGGVGLEPCPHILLVRNGLGGPPAEGPNVTQLAHL